MYTLATISDVIQVHPAGFSKSSYRAIEDLINERYADKIIHKVGLCLGLHSIVRASEGLIGHGTGIVNVNVDFKLVVFRPFKGEIIRASIAQSAEEGIALTMDFYDDLIVPPETLFDNSKWQHDESDDRWNWVWHTGDDGEQEYYFDHAETCLVRVEEEQWYDVSPDDLREQNGEEGEEDLRIPPYRIRGSMMHSGLGPTLWWSGEAVEADAEMEEAA